MKNFSNNAFLSLIRQVVLKTTYVLVSLSLILSSQAMATTEAKPADKFDLSNWKITLPLDKNRDGKVDEVDVRALKKYSHPDFFYLDENGHMVFAAPNKAKTTSGSTNTRSELTASSFA